MVKIREWEKTLAVANLVYFLGICLLSRILYGIPETEIKSLWDNSGLKVSEFAFCLGLFFLLASILPILLARLLEFVWKKKRNEKITNPEIP